MNPNRFIVDPAGEWRAPVCVEEFLDRADECVAELQACIDFPTGDPRAAVAELRRLLQNHRKVALAATNIAEPEATQADEPKAPSLRYENWQLAHMAGNAPLPNAAVIVLALRRLAEESGITVQELLG